MADLYCEFAEVRQRRTCGQCDAGPALRLALAQETRDRHRTPGTG